jgi:hypothetical protein
MRPCIVRFVLLLTVACFVAMQPAMRGQDSKTSEVLTLEQAIELARVTSGMRPWMPCAPNGGQPSTWTYSS